MRSRSSSMQLVCTSPANKAQRMRRFGSTESAHMEALAQRMVTTPSMVKVQLASKPSNQERAMIEIQTTIKNGCRSWHKGP